MWIMLEIDFDDYFLNYLVYNISFVNIIKYGCLIEIFKTDNV